MEVAAGDGVGSLESGDPEAPGHDVNDAVSALDHERRLPELAIRKALGARPEQLVAVVAAGGVRTYAMGVAIGLGGSVAAGQALRGLLFEVSIVDPVSLATAIAVLTLTTSLAMLPSLRRGLRADPRTALESR